MPNITIEITCRCSQCGRVLETDRMGYEGEPYILDVEPCTKCLDDENNKGRESMFEDIREGLVKVD